MSIQLLDQETINKIAAGEVVERPMAVVKELVENSIDAGANAITVEIKEGGVGLIRITDNGKGIGKNEIRIAFQKHSTSKIKDIKDLLAIKSLGFRGEALASIAAVSQVELITKTANDFVGVRYLIDGEGESLMEEVGCPEGSTFLVRNLFYNVPARRKFLKTAATEAGYILDIVERFAMSYPNVSFKFILNGGQKFQTSGNGNLKDVIFNIYGKDVANNLFEVKEKGNHISIKGYIGKPVISRGNRNYMNYFVNGRYVRSTVVNRAIEDAYKGYTMSHRYPFTAILLGVNGEEVDVNVHPTKMEVRFQNQEAVYNKIYHTLADALKEKVLIPEITSGEEKKQRNAMTKRDVPEPFETVRRSQTETSESVTDFPKGQTPKPDASPDAPHNRTWTFGEGPLPYMEGEAKQQTLFEEELPKEEAKPEWRIIGQLFLTYWIIEHGEKMFIVDQHAAHEKVLYENVMESLEKGERLSQMVSPPTIITLSMREEAVLHTNKEHIRQLGFEIEPFGGREYAISGVPTYLADMADGELFMEWLDMLMEDGGGATPEAILNKVAALSCKAAVKGNHSYSLQEANALLLSLFKLKNPYHCPHGRPTMVSMDKKEIEKRFKRVL